MTEFGSPRVLIYGLQSSGASLVAFFGAQDPEALTVIDLWNPERSPGLEHPGPVILKATVGPIAVDDHIERFGPTAKVLVLRNPVDQISVLDRENFRDYAEPLERKLATFDQVFAERAQEFDLVVEYEQLIVAPSEVADEFRRLGLQLPENAHLFPRRLQDVVSDACGRSPWCAENWRRRWGTGRIDETALPLRSIPVAHISGAADLARRYCPTVLARYG